MEAESIAYTVCQYFGIETNENSFAYVANWSSGRDVKELQASLDIIRKTSTELINAIETNFKELSKERGVNAEIIAAEAAIAGILANKAVAKPEEETVKPVQEVEASEQESDKTEQEVENPEQVFDNLELGFENTVIETEA